MKKHLFLALMILTLAGFSQDPVIDKMLKQLRSSKTSSQKANTIYQKIDSTYNWNYDTILLKWKTTPSLRTRNYVYDSNNNLVSYITQIYYSPDWVNSEKEVNMFDVNNDCTYSIRFQWNGTGWDSSFKRILAYDTNRNLLSYESYSWGGTSWNPYNRGFYTYNANQKMTGTLYESWDWTNNAWQGTRQYIYTYDVNDDTLTSERENYINNSWVPDWQNTYSYNSNRNLLTSANETYSNSTWVKNFKVNYTYNSNNAIISYTDQTGNGPVWEDLSRATYTLDINFDPKEILLENWTGTSWTNNYKGTCTYVAGNLTTYTSSIWSGSNWVNSSKGIMTYNTNNILLNRTSQNWNGFGWTNSWREVHTYDGNNNETSYDQQVWNSNKWKNTQNAYRNKFDNNNFQYVSAFRYYDYNRPSFITYGDSSYAFYKSVVGLDEKSVSPNFVSIYPNPSNGYFNLGTLENNGEIEVYDLVGTKVYQTKIESTNECLNLVTLPKGIYITIVSQGKKRNVQKIVIE